MPKKRDPFTRFMECVQRSPNGCLLWTGEIIRNGYGRFFVRKNSKKKIRPMAHRWIFEYLKGPIPEGLELDHLCRTRACVEVNHLEPVTSRVNVLRGETEAARNKAKTHCKHGHPLSGDNLFYDSQGYRQCRICQRRANRKYYYANHAWELKRFRERAQRKKLP